MTDAQKKAMSKRMLAYHRNHKANRTKVDDKHDLALNLLKTVVKLLGGKS